MIKLRKKIAFTMAEVLMVLGIIGVVASIALPNLNDSADDQVNLAKAKKVYAELSSAWDRAMIKNSITNASSVTAANVAGKMKDNLKIKGTSSSYAPASLSSNTDCTGSATLLPDGSTFCVAKYIFGDIFFTVVFDVDGPNKGMNVIGNDIFYSTITFRSGQINSPGLDPFNQNSAVDKTSNNIITSGGSVSVYDALMWILTYNNMDYNNCSVKWVTATTCR